MSTPHYHLHSRNHAHLIRTDDDELVSSEVGIMHPNIVKFGYALLFIVFFAMLGLLIWASVVFADERPYMASNASTEIVGDYRIYYNRAAEPYSGQPARVLTGVTSSDVCVETCTADSTCRFFTYDQTNARCYLYEGGVLPGQYAESAVPGPTQLNTSVYTKLGGLVSQLRGSLRNGNSTIF